LQAELPHGLAGLVLRIDRQGDDADVALLQRAEVLLKVG
jgi:hypothetical protein